MLPAVPQRSRVCRLPSTCLFGARMQLQPSPAQGVHTREAGPRGAPAPAADGV